METYETLWKQLFGLPQDFPTSSIVCKKISISAIKIEGNFKEMLVVKNNNNLTKIRRKFYGK